MSKKITCFLTMAITMLLAMPTEAQNLADKQTAPKTKVIKSVGQRSLSKVATMNPEKTMPLTKVEMAAKAKAETAKAQTGKKAKDNPGRRSVQSVNVPQMSTSLRTPKKILLASGESIDEHGIIISPAEGSRKIYRRSGMSYENTDMLRQVEQSGDVQIVFCDDGTVYICNIMNGFTTTSWVKGQIEGNTLTVATKQPIYYNAQADATYSINWGLSDEAGFFSYYPEFADHFTFEIDQEANTISLLNSSEHVFMGMFWDDDNAFTFVGDYETVWTYVKDFEPMAVVTVNAPEGLATESWYTKGHLSTNGQTEAIRGNVTIGFADNDIYLKGIFADFPEAWMKGTINEGTVTFDGLQTQGTKDGQALYAVGAESGSLAPFTMTYDAENKVLTSNKKLLLNASETNFNTEIQYEDLTIQLSDPFAPIEVLPYTNSLDTQDEWEMFTVVDANDDGSTWHQYEGMASYKYNSDNAGDDWLFSPAFRLEAGKCYHFSIEALTSSSNYEERFEVKLGNATTPNDMMMEIIAPTNIINEFPIVFENKLITVSEPGIYYIGIHAISDADQASLRVDNFMLDETILTAPAAVNDLTVTPDDSDPIATLHFTAPTTTIGGDNLTSITKIEILREGEVIATLENVAPGSEQTYIDNDENLVSGTYHYQLLCYNADGKGDMSKVVSVQLVKVRYLPYYADFSNIEDYEQFLVLDANEDYFTWEWGGSHATYSYNTDQQADDYLISPPLHMDAGKSYDILVDAGSAGYPERFEIVAGTAPTVEGLSFKLLENCEVTYEDTKDFSTTFSPTETGTYYIAVHCISDPDLYELWINSMSVEQGPEGNAPAAPLIELIPGEAGALMATLNITAPDQTFDGTANLTENLTKIDIYRDGQLLTEISDVIPGAVVNFVDDQLTEPGFHTYQAVPYNANGIGGKSEKVTSYIGMDIPQSVTNINVNDHLTSVLISWDKVSNIGRNGAYVNTAEVVYKIYACEPNSTYLIDTEPVATVKDADSYELTFDSNEGDQGYQAWIVTATNEVGESYIEDESMVTMITGTPYDLPIVEGFEDGTTHYYWDSNSVALQFSQSSDDDGIAFALVKQEVGDIFLSSGKLNINDATNPVLLFDAVGFGVNKVTIIGRNNSGEAVELATEAIDDTKYTPVKVSLASLKQEGYAQFAIMATITSPTTFDEWTGEILEEGDALVLDNIRVIDLYQHNLAVELSAPSTVKAGKTADILATITNWGEQAAKDFTLTIKANDQILLQQVIDEEIAPFKQKQFATKLSTTIFEEAGDRTISAQVDYSAEEQATDNYAEAIITIEDSNAPAPENLTAEDKGAAGVDLSWTAPTPTEAEYTEEFDAIDIFPTFDIGGITASEHTGMIGEWTVYDATGAEVYGWNGISFPNMGAPSAWMVFDFEKAGFTGVTGHSGAQAMLSVCPIPAADGQIPADHWLISPELSGTAQTISFYLRAITDNYGEESLEVLASSTDKNPESFTLVESIMTDAVEWTPYYASLPEGTKYFAIRHTSNDIFGVFIDDITFNFVSTVKNYNIYYEGNKIASVEDGVTTYTVDESLLEAGERTFAVTAVYANGQESKPVTAQVYVTTGIDMITTSGKPVDIYTVDGKLVRRQATSFDGLKGIFVIDGKAIILK